MTAKTDKKPRTGTERMNLIRKLLKWRIVLQYIGAAIMVPAVVLGVLMNFDLVPTSLAVTLLWAIAVAIIPLTGSITCTIIVNKMRDKMISKMGKIDISPDDK